MLNTPERQVPSVVSCPSFVAGPVVKRSTVVLVIFMRWWCNPLHSIVAPLMLVVGLQHLAEGCALNRFEMVTYSTHFYHNKQRVGWDGLALLCPIDTVCIYRAGNVGDEHLCGSTASKQRHRQKGEGGGEVDVDARHVCIRSKAWLSNVTGLHQAERCKLENGWRGYTNVYERFTKKKGIRTICTRKISASTSAK